MQASLAREDNHEQTVFATGHVDGNGTLIPRRNGAQGGGEAAPGNGYLGNRRTRIIRDGRLGGVMTRRKARHEGQQRKKVQVGGGGLHRKSEETKEMPRGDSGGGGRSEALPNLIIVSDLRDDVVDKMKIPQTYASSR